MKKVKITQQHIDDGKRHNCYECPIALAVARRSFPLGARVTADGIQVGFQWQFGYHPYIASPDIIDWINRFDEGEDVEPFTLILSNNHATKEAAECSSTQKTE